MTPADLHGFFAASAGVAGALVGLLFVAITVAQEQLVAPGAAQSHRVRAAAALTAFTNALTVSLFALLPGAEVGWAALSVALVGLVSIAASLLALVRVRQAQPGALRDALFLLGLGITFALQLFFGVRVASDPRDASGVENIAVLVIVCFLIGIVRSWELIGGPHFALRRELSAIVRGSQPEDDESADPLV